MDPVLHADTPALVEPALVSTTSIHSRCALRSLGRAGGGAAALSGRPRGAPRTHARERTMGIALEPVHSPRRVLGILLLWLRRHCIFPRGSHALPGRGIAA